MRIAVDAMGGDFSPRQVVLGTVDAARRLEGIERLYLVGREDAIRAECPGPLPSNVEIVSASEVVEMDEAPAIALRRKKDSSVGRAIDLVKNGQADAVFSAGNTGAAVAGATLKLRTLEGVLRPAIATIMPTVKEPFVLVDAGANPDCTAEMLRQFAIMGSVYASGILNRPRPSVGLLSVGTEEGKGNDITRQTFDLLRQCPNLHFHGNVEGHDLFEGTVDVVVCDGFVGNVVLKTAESVSHAIGHWIKEEAGRHPVFMLGAMLMRGAFRKLKKKADPSATGGAPLLGANGVVIIGHGASNAEAVFNGIRVASEAVRQHINASITEQIRALPPLAVS